MNGRWDEKVEAATRSNRPPIILRPWVAQPGQRRLEDKDARLLVSQGAPTEPGYLTTVSLLLGFLGMLIAAWITAEFGSGMAVGLAVGGVFGAVIGGLIDERVKANWTERKAELTSRVRVFSSDVARSPELAELGQLDRSIELLELPADQADEVKRTMQHVIWVAAQHRAPAMLRRQLAWARELHEAALAASEAYVLGDVRSERNPTDDTVNALHALTESLVEIENELAGTEPRGLE